MRGFESLPQGCLSFDLFAQSSLTCHRRNGHNMTMVLLDHRREELPSHPEVGHSVDLESQPYSLLRLVQD